MSGLIINIDYLKLDIISTSRETTSLSYEVETRGWKSPVPIMLFVETGLLFLLGLVVQLLTSFLPLAILSYTIAVIILLITLFLVIPTGKKIDKFFHKLLLPRLDRYIDIINEHMES